MKSKTFWGRFSDLSPFIILDEELYQISDINGNENSCIRSGNVSLDILNPVSILYLETIEKERYRDQIFQFQKQFVAEALKEEIFSRDEIKNFDNVTKALTFILYDLIDNKTGKEIIDSILAEEEKLVKIDNNADNVAEIRRSIASRLEKEVVTPVIIGDGKTNNSSILTKLLNGVPVYVSNGRVYKLTEKYDDGGFYVKLKGQIYFIEDLCDINKVEEAYKKATMLDLKKEALNEFDDQFKAANVDKKNLGLIERFAQKKEFRYDHLGYVRDGETFYVFWEVPKFAMQNPLRPKVYHPFPASKVAINVNYSNGQAYHEGSYILDAMVHPFLQNWEAKKQHICILGERPFDNKTYSMVRHLSNTVNAFINGLTIESLKLHGIESEDALYFGAPLKKSLTAVGELSREEAVKQGYLITNEWNLKEEKNV